MPIVRYNEKLLENFIRDFPEEFIGESLTLQEQQPILAGFQPDLLFRDAEGVKKGVRSALDSFKEYH